MPGTSGAGSRRRVSPSTTIRLPWAADPRAFRRLVAAIRRQRPAIVHTHLVHADFLGLIAGRICGVPVLASTKHGFNRFRERRSFALADRSSADSPIRTSRSRAAWPATWSSAEGFGAEEFAVVHYGIEPGPEPPPCDLDTPRLLCVGRLVPIKGHEVLLRAFAEARDAVPGLELQLAGSGPLETELRRRVDELRLGESVAIPRPRVPDRAVDGGRRDRRRALARRGLRDGRARGDGARPGRDRQRRRRPAGDRRRRRDGPDRSPCRSRRGWRKAIVELASDLPRAAAMGQAGRRRALTAFRQERCTEQTAALYEAALARAGLA